MHLDELLIRNYRGIDFFSASNLGAVNLVVGSNGAGKTTLLDAIRTYASRGRYTTLHSILLSRDEIHSASSDSDDLDDFRRSYGSCERPPVDWTSLFYGRSLLPKCEICIGSDSVENQLTISVKPLYPVRRVRDTSLYGVRHNDLGIVKHLFVLKGAFGGSEFIIPNTEFLLDLEAGAYSNVRSPPKAYGCLEKQCPN